MSEKPPIRLIGVRQNNLRNIQVEFPTRKLTVITGVSGSGKSSLVFDTLYAEGQRRYIESLSTYTRQFLEKMPKPDLDAIENIPPAIALEQKNHVVNSRSTVGTQTEIYDYLRVLFAKVGQTQCIQCQSLVKKINPSLILEWSKEWLPGKKVLITAPLKIYSKKTPSFESISQIVLEQGFKRILIQKDDKLELIDLQDLQSSVKVNFKKDSIFIVIDRLKIPSTSADTKLDKDSLSRIRDSLEQALQVGQGQMSFVNLDESQFKTFRLGFNCLNCGTEHREPEPHLFSFNSPVGACSKCSGFGHTLELDENKVVPDPSKTLKNGAIDPFSKPSFADWQKDLFRFAERHNISIGKRYRDLTLSERNLLWKGDPKDDTFPGIEACFEELKKWKYKLYVRVFIRRYQNQMLCPECKGARLKHEALAVKLGSQAIHQVLNSTVKQALFWIKTLKLSPSEKKISKDVYDQIERRLTLLEEVGVEYLTLSRLAKTLSGGEFQRINLATQLGNGLCGTLYVLDEPSIGLHAADTDRLIGVLNRLRDQGNTVVVVEHDLEVIRSADWVIELGPLAGKKGGELIAQCTPQTLIHTQASVTGKYLSEAFKITRSHTLRPEPKRFLRLEGCRENNLKNLNVTIPLDRFVVITGVSGSGKSTLVHKTLYQALSKIFNPTNEPVGRYERIYGVDQLSGVVLLDQSPIGRSSRSNPATYLKAWDEIRRIYANQVLSLRRGYTPQYFSFNVDGGRCPICKGEGEITLDMHFMAEIKLPCEECQGRRFKKNILEIQYRGKNIYQLLTSTIDETYELFRDHPTLVRKLGILRDVGLGYLELGQSGASLSGGESQRLKIAATLDERIGNNLLYIFDEPTTGLHLEDIKRLLQVIQDLVDSKQSVLMIEHHLDVIAQADWVLDLGPGGGEEGGYLMASGPPDFILRNEASITGKMLKKQGYRFPVRPEREGRLEL